jgi:hypothetical protein
MIEEFEAGKYYRYIGPDDLPDGWVSEMRYMMDGKPHLCEKSNGGSSAKFSDINGMWCYSGKGMNYLFEVEMIEEKLNKELKHGDKVKIKSGEMGKHKVGDIGVISAWNPSGSIKVTINGEEQSYFACELELVESKKKDSVEDSVTYSINTSYYTTTDGNFWRT